mgnify:CR=1 FL=1
MTTDKARTNPNPADAETLDVEELAEVKEVAEGEDATAPETLVMETETIERKAQQYPPQKPQHGFQRTCQQGQQGQQGPQGPQAPRYQAGPAQFAASARRPAPSVFVAESTFQSTTTNLGPKGTPAPFRVGLLIWSVILIMFGLLTLISGIAAPVSLQGLVTTLLALAGIAFIILAIVQKQKGA